MIRASILVTLLVLLLCGLVAVTYSLHVTPREGHLDFYPRWEGTQRVLSGENPYLRPYDYQPYAYPVTVSIFLLPVFLLPPVLGASIWSVLQIFFVALGVFLWLRLMRFEASPWIVSGVLFAGLIGWRYPMINYASSNFVGFIFFCYVFSLWLWLEHGLPVHAGIVLAWTTFRPESTIITMFFLLYLLIQRQWGYVLGFLFTISSVMVVSWILVGDWFRDFFQAITAYRDYANPIIPIMLAAWVFRVLITFLCGYGWSVVIRYCWRQPTHVLSMIVITVLLFGISTNPYVLTLLLIPLLTIFAYLRQGVMLALWSLVMFSPWIRPYALRTPGLHDLVIMPALALILFFYLSTVPYLRKSLVRSYT